MFNNPDVYQQIASDRAADLRRSAGRPRGRRPRPNRVLSRLAIFGRN